MIRCGHASKMKPRQKYIRLLKNQMDRFGTPAKMKDTLCSTISDWFDNGSVDPSKYPAKYTNAIETQTAIGWHHIFMGHFSVEQANSHSPFESPSGTLCKV